MNNYVLSKMAKLEIEKENFRRKGVRKYVCDKLKNYWKDEDGAGVIELVLILVVLIGFIVVFRDRIKELLDNVYTKINSEASSLYGTSD